MYSRSAWLEKHSEIKRILFDYKERTIQDRFITLVLEVLMMLIEDKLNEKA